MALSLVISHYSDSVDIQRNKWVYSVHEDRSKQNQSSKYLSYRPWEWESSLEDIPSILEEEVDESIFSDASSSFDEKNGRYATIYE